MASDIESARRRSILGALVLSFLILGGHWLPLPSVVVDEKGHILCGVSSKASEPILAIAGDGLRDTVS